MGKPSLTLKNVTSAKASGGKVGYSGNAITGTAVLPLPDVQGLGPKLKLVATDATFTKSGLPGASATLEIPGKANLTFNAQSKMFKGDVTTKTDLFSKPLTMKLAVDQKGPSTSFDSTYAVSKSTKLNAKYSFDSNAVALKATHNVDKLTLESTYDMTSEAWSVSAARKVDKANVKLSYASSKKAAVDITLKPCKLTLAAPVANLGAATASFTIEKALA